MAGGLSAEEIERAKHVFDIYDFEGKGEIDAFDLNKSLRALVTFPTMKSVEKLGGEKKRGAKKLKMQDFLTAYAGVKADKDVGSMADFQECLKLYDKDGSGLMAFEELKALMKTMGERLEPEEAEAIMNECADPMDEDGFTPWQKFLDRLIAGPKMD